jgi:hypothetical protein
MAVTWSLYTLRGRRHAYPRLMQLLTPEVEKSISEKALTTRSKP